jgi:hypothetical protein
MRTLEFAQSATRYPQNPQILVPLKLGCCNTRQRRSIKFLLDIQFGRTCMSNIFIYFIVILIEFDQMRGLCHPIPLQQSSSLP